MRAVPIAHCALPREMPMTAVLDANDPDGGVVSLLLRPGMRRPTALPPDVLRALGKDHDARTRAGSATADTADALAWLAAHRVQHLLVGHAQWATGTDQTLLAALHLAQRAGIALTFVSGYDSYEPALPFVQEHGGQDIPWAAVLASLPPSKRAHATAGSSTARNGESDRVGATAGARPADMPPSSRVLDEMPDDVPHADAVLFRAACRDLLLPPQFAVADRLYRDSYRSARAALGPGATTEHASKLVQSLLATVDRPAAAVIAARAAQAAALANGWLLRIAMDALPALVADASHRSLTAAELRLLRRLSAPWRAVAVALTDAGMSVDDLVAVRIGDFTEDGAMLKTPLRGPLADDARLCVRAQLAARRLEGAAPGDRLLHDRTDRAVRDALHSARTQLGIPLLIPRHRRGRAPDRWAQQLAVSVSPVSAA